MTRPEECLVMAGTYVPYLVDSRSYLYLLRYVTSSTGSRFTQKPICATEPRFLFLKVHTVVHPTK